MEGGHKLGGGLSIFLADPELDPSLRHPGEALDGHHPGGLDDDY
ncbi:MAG: hypothetical protein ACRC1K_25565 [Planctomycetia bacterium]